MAILSKIRERSLALIAVIGLALFAFVLDPSTISDFFNSSKINKVGVVEGEPISRQEFAEAVDNYKRSGGNRATEMQAAKFVWDNILREKIYENQLEEAGITIGETDVWNQIISNQFIQTNQQFLNEAGLFDEDKFKLFLSQIQQSEDQRTWEAWKGFMDGIASTFKTDTYNNLVNAGLGASLKEGEFQYLEENTKFSADFVFIPYTSIADSLITVKKSDIESYIKKSPKSFETEASRDIRYVEFKLEPTEKDKQDIKAEVAKLIEDRKEYSKVSKSEVTVLGFKNATEYEEFFQENGSDLPFSENYLATSDLIPAIKDQMATKQVNDVVGPYENLRRVNVSKIIDIVQKPDSVKTSHIIVPFVGSLAANPSVTKTEAQAKKTIDSIYRLVRNNKEKFAEIANEINTDGTKGKDGDIGWVRYNVAYSANFDKDFADYMYNNGKGKVGVVKTKFGFHIIRIDDVTKKTKLYKLVTFSRDILPSQETENAVFQKVENFALEIGSKYNTFEEAVKGNNLNSKPAIGLKMFDDRVPGLSGNQRDIISWAFKGDTKLNQYKRFDLDNGGYVVAIVTGKANKGLKSALAASATVRPKIVNEQKAELIKKKMNGSTLADIAKANNVNVRKMANVALRSPSITGVGSEPKIIGSMFLAVENQLYNQIVGDKGVFAYVITKKESPTELPNYESVRQRLAAQRRSKTINIFKALKNTLDIKDNRDYYYGIEQ